MNLLEPPASTKITNTSNIPPRSMGAILIDAGVLSTENAERILRVQKALGMRFGDAAIQLGLLSEADIRFALASQFDYPYLSTEDNSLSPELVAAYTPFSPVVEQLRALRSQLMLRCFDSSAQRKALAIVSPGKKEGRSFIAANLAIVFSQLGERTLLIDADLRQPRQHELFKLGNQSGLSELLAGRNTAHEVTIRISSLLGLFILPAGAVPPNPQELLGRAVFSETLNAFSRDFDVIIIDTPAASDYADAQTIAVRAGSALLLACQNQSTMPAVSELSDRLRQSGANLVGCVLNDI
jgi:chain length determinant protein tyrosine kinase EpsG